VGSQSFYLRMPDGLARRLNSFLDDPASGYESIEEFVAVAVRNQLNADRAPTLMGGREIRTVESAEGNASAPIRTKRHSLGDLADETAGFELFGQPPLQANAALATKVENVDERLFALTNRLSQLKVAVRVCANMATPGHWPELKEFQTKAAATARSVGVMLRDRPPIKLTSTGGSFRVAVGYPIGEEPEKAQARFISSFTIGVIGDRVVGPLAILGLANVVDGRVALTEAGWRFSTLPTPMSGEINEGDLLSPAEARELRERLREATAEATAIREFIRDVRRSNGSQAKVDGLLNQQHPEWNKQQIIAQRAAMVGRLSDVDVLEVEGRGGGAEIRLLPAHMEFND
jgi:hypothetical protein